MDNKTYDLLKRVAQLYLPALATAYAVIAGLWGVPNVEEVVGTIVAIDTALGVVLQIKTTQYNNSDEKYDGVIDVEETPEGVKKLNTRLTKIENPYDVDQQDELVFKVNKTKGAALDPDFDES